jgi:hypothetical protein
MTQDEIIEMARQAGIYHAFDSEGHWDGLTNVKLIERHPPHPNDLIYGDERIVEILEAFAKLVDAKAIAKFESQEPVAWISPKGHIHFDPYLDSVPLYTYPPQRTEPLIGCVNHDCAKCQEKNT